MTDTASSCAACHKTAPVVTLKRCSRCQAVWYCSTDCQKADFKTHKAWCKAKAAGDPPHPYYGLDKLRERHEIVEKHSGKNGPDDIEDQLLMLAELVYKRGPGDEDNIPHMSRLRIWSSYNLGSYIGVQFNIYWPALPLHVTHGA